jgi:hypothetical protein
MKRLVKLSSIAFWVIYLGVVHQVFAQNFSHQFSLGKIDKSGLYKVVLSPELRSLAQANFSDVRLSSFADSLVEVPFFIRQENDDSANWDIRKYSLAHSGNLDTGIYPRIQISRRELPQEKRTQILVYSHQKYEINQIQFVIQSPFYFSREVSMYTKELQRHTRLKKGMQKNLLGSFYIKKGESHEFAMDHTLTDTLYIDILNLDNPSLAISELIIKQSPKVLYTYLTKGDMPTLFCGNSTLPFPIYDLEQFSSEILKAPISELKIGEGKSKLIAAPSKAILSFWQSKEFLWVCLILAMGFTAYFSWSIMNKKSVN